MVLVKWTYIATVYNSVIDEYRMLERHQNFQAIQDGIKTLSKALEDILVRLAKLEYLLPHLAVSFTLITD